MNNQNFILYFEFYGRKLKTTIFAKSENEAKEKVRNRINFLKVEVEKQDTFGFIQDVVSGKIK